jgi:hypothetical protein
VHTERQFTGELDLFNDRDILVGGRMGADGRVARMNRVQFRRLLAAEPDIAETIMRAFILRRVGLIQHGQGAVTLVVSRHQNVGALLAHPEVPEPQRLSPPPSRCARRRGGRDCDARGARDDCRGRADRGLRARTGR